jgi:protein gp37
VWANRYGVSWGNDAPRKAIKSVWGNLQGMQDKAKKAGDTHRVFVGSMMDIFEKSKECVNENGEVIGTTDELRNRLFNEVIPNTPNLLYLLLTKRPSNINKMIPDEWKITPPKNVMFGTSVVNPETATTLIPQLLKVKGNLFLSVEPQLGFINFENHLSGIKWLIQGGESGHNKRPFNTDWARHTRDVCAKAGVAYFFKQIDKIKPIPDDLHIRQFPAL